MKFNTSNSAFVLIIGIGAMSPLLLRLSNASLSDCGPYGKSVDRWCDALAAGPTAMFA
jgi:hypothetical protein